MGCRSRSGRHSIPARMQRPRARSHRRRARQSGSTPLRTMAPRLDCAQQPAPGGDGEIPKDRHARHARRDLLEKFQPFPADAEFDTLKPVALPPGRARLSTKPALTGSMTVTNTMGTVRVACSNGPRIEAPEARMTSGASATSSAAYYEWGRACHRHSGSRSGCCGPSVQPNCRQPLHECRQAGPSSASSAG